MNKKFIQKKKRFTFVISRKNSIW